MNDQHANDVEWDARLREGMTALAERAPHDPDLAGTIRHRAGRGRRRTTVLMVAATVVAAGGTVWVAGAVRGPDSSSGRTSSQPTPTSYSCPASTPVAVIPAWARAGFSDPRPKIPYVLGDAGRIVALVFGDPLTAPESADHANKVLWVAKTGSGPLTIDARLSGAADSTVIELPAAGPSYLDLPTPGCWHLDLSWGDQTDAMIIRVHAP